MASDPGCHVLGIRGDHLVHQLIGQRGGIDILALHGRRVFAQCVGGDVDQLGVVRVIPAVAASSASIDLDIAALPSKRA